MKEKEKERKEKKRESTCASPIQIVISFSALRAIPANPVRKARALATPRVTKIRRGS